MRPIWLCIFSCRPFEDTFESTRWRKLKQMQPMWFYILSGRRFDEKFENAKWRKPAPLSFRLGLGFKGQLKWVLSIEWSTSLSDISTGTLTFKPWMTLYVWVSGFRVQGSIIEYWVLSDPPPLSDISTGTLTLKPWMVLYVWVLGLGSRGWLLSIEYWVTHPPCLTSPPTPWPLSFEWYCIFGFWV